MRRKVPGSETPASGPLPRRHAQGRPEHRRGTPARKAGESLQPPRSGQPRRASAGGGVPRAGRLSHVDRTGAPRMVDVSAKRVTAREAVARGRITMSAEAVGQIRRGALAKGDPLQTARLAGIMAAKRTSDLIPLCHPLPLSHADVTLQAVADGYEIEARVRTSAQTGVEMEALAAVAVAALTIYDMVKAVDKAMVISEIRLMEKRGGKTDYRRAEGAEGSWRPGGRGRGPGG